MIWPDVVQVAMEVEDGVDTRGNPKYKWINEPVRGQVVALDTDAVLSASRDAVITRYRVALAPALDIPADVGNGLKVGWGVYPLVDRTSDLRVDGSVERHMVRGRLHHYEFIVRQILG